MKKAERVSFGVASVAARNMKNHVKEIRSIAASALSNRRWGMRP